MCEAWSKISDAKDCVPVLQVRTDLSGVNTPTPTASQPRFIASFPQGGYPWGFHPACSWGCRWAPFPPLLYLWPGFLALHSFVSGHNVSSPEKLWNPTACFQRAAACLLCALSPWWKHCEDFGLLTKITGELPQWSVTCVFCSFLSIVLDLLA